MSAATSGVPAWVADDLRGVERDKALAHELGHVVLGKPEGIPKAAIERAADVFAREFRARRELPGQRWREMMARHR